MATIDPGHGAPVASRGALPVSLRPMLLKCMVHLTLAHFDDDARALTARLRQKYKSSGGVPGDWPDRHTELMNLDFPSGLQTPRADDTQMWWSRAPEPQTEVGIGPQPLDEPGPGAGARSREAAATGAEKVGPSPAEPAAQFPVPADGALTDAGPGWWKDQPQPPRAGPEAPARRWPGDRGPPPPDDHALVPQPPGESLPGESPIPQRRIRMLRAGQARVFGLGIIDAILLGFVTIRPHDASPTPGTSQGAGRPGRGSGPCGRVSRCVITTAPSGLTPVEVVEKLYADINHRAFCAAWNLGAYTITPGEPSRQYVASFRNLGHDVLTVESVSGTDPVIVNIALQVFKNASPATFTGFYKVQNGR